MAHDTLPATAEVAQKQRTEVPLDQLSRLSSQLEALMVTITGDGFRNFADHNDDVQENVLWLVSSMAQQIRIAVDQMVEDSVALFRLDRERRHG